MSANVQPYVLIIYHLFYYESMRLVLFILNTSDKLTVQVTNEHSLKVFFVKQYCCRLFSYKSVTGVHMYVDYDCSTLSVRSANPRFLSRALDVAINKSRVFNRGEERVVNVLRDLQSLRV